MRKKIWIMLICISVSFNTHVLKSRAAGDQWVEEMKAAVGLSVGSLDPRFPDLEVGETVGDENTPGGGHADFPADSNKLDPNRQDVSKIIEEWILIAEPPQNATLGARFRYDKWGRIIGQTADGATIRTAGKPDYALSTPEDTTWSLRKKLDSVNHCTLEEYVNKKLNNQSTADCKGRYKASQTVFVPNLRGRPLASAKKELERAGLKIKTSDKPAPSKKKELTVAAQSPRPGTQIKKGQTVELVVFGPFTSMVIVSNFTGVSLSEAKSWLKQNGLKSKQTAGKAAPSKAQEFTIAAQSPASGTRLKKGDTVELVIFGPFIERVTVPDVTRLTADEAIERIGASGLKVRKRTVGRSGSKQWSGRVKNVKPAAGTKVAPNTVVVVSVYGEYIPSKEELVAQHDCSRYTGTRAYWDNASGKPGCRCVNGQIWSRKQNRCIRKLSPNEICTRDYPGTIAKGRTSDGKINCVCPNGYFWKYHRCVRRSSGGQGTSTAKKKTRNQCAAALAHIKLLVALTNERNRKLSNKLIGNAIVQAKRDGCSEKEISAAMGRASAGKGKKTGGQKTGGGWDDEVCSCVDENGRRYHEPLGQDCGFGPEEMRDYCD